MNKKKVFLVCMAFLSLLIWAASPAFAAIRTINSDKAGQYIDIRDYAVKGRVTIFYFYSRYCSACLKILPLMERLAAKRPDLVIYKVDINRPTISAIDWYSPVCVQYKIRELPYLFVLDEKGKPRSAGQGANREVQDYMVKAGIKW